MEVWNLKYISAELRYEKMGEGMRFDSETMRQSVERMKSPMYIVRFKYNTKEQEDELDQSIIKSTQTKD